MPHGDRRNELSGAWVLRSEFERSSADARAVDGFIIPGQWRTKMTFTKKIKIDKVGKAFQDLLSWSPQGVTATTKEATKLLAPLSDADLVVLHAHFGEHYTHWHQYAEPDLDGEPESCPTMTTAMLSWPSKRCMTQLRRVGSSLTYTRPA
jgi:hypothetical protein